MPQLRKDVIKLHVCQSVARPPLWSIHVNLFVVVSIVVLIFFVLALVVLALVILALIILALIVLFRNDRRAPLLLSRYAIILDHLRSPFRNKSIVLDLLPPAWLLADHPREVAHAKLDERDRIANVEFEW